MVLKLFELLNIILSAVVGGMYWGPWLALSRSLATFNPDAFLAIVNRLNQNMAPLMTFLTPAGLLATLPTLYLTFGSHPTTFYLTLAGFVSFLVALVVTVRIEVPLVMQMVGWDAANLPPHWQQVRDRWVNFHIIRVVAGLAGLMLLVAGALA